MSLRLEGIKIKIQDQLDRFIAAIEREANKEIEQILNEAEESKKSELTSKEDEVLYNAYEMIQGKVSESSVETKKEISKRQLEYKKSLLERRKQLELQVFRNVEQKILDFRNEPDYENWIISKIKKFSEEYNQDNVVFQIGLFDRKLEGKILVAYGKPCKVECVDSIKLGGVIFADYKNSYIIDETFDSILEDEKEWFHNHMNEFLGDSNKI